MNWNPKKVQLPRLLSLAALALLFFTVQAKAAVSEGQFTLNTPTQWGDVLLQPGTYEFSIPSATFPYKVYVKGNGQHAVFFSSVTDLPPAERLETMEAKLKLVVINGRAVVRSLLVPKLGLAFEFQVPKELKAASRVQAPAGGNHGSGTH
jgi:hypothetical protein